MHWNIFLFDAPINLFLLRSYALLMEHKIFKTKIAEDWVKKNFSEIFG